MKRFKGCGVTILGKENRKCKCPKAGTYLAHVRLAKKASVAEVKGDDIIEEAGPGHIELPWWHLAFLLSERFLNRGVT